MTDQQKKIMMKEKNPDISIVMPVYNVEKYIDRCMASILKQTIFEKAPGTVTEKALGTATGAATGTATGTATEKAPGTASGTTTGTDSKENDPVSAEIILVDDGSKDTSGEICDTYAGHVHDRLEVSVIHQVNGGASAARNAGLRAARGTWIVFIDPDDYIESDYLESAYRYALETQADLVCFDGWREYGGGRSRGWWHFKESFVTTDPVKLTEMQCLCIFRWPEPGRPDQILGGPWDKLYNREFLMNNNLHFPSGLRAHDDSAFNFHTFGKACKIAYLHKRLYHYCMNQGTITSSWNPERPEIDRKVFAYLRRCIMEQEHRVISHDLDVSTWPRRKRMLENAYRLRVIKSALVRVKLRLKGLKSRRNK